MKIIESLASMIAEDPTVVGSIFVFDPITDYFPFKADGAINYWSLIETQSNYFIPRSDDMYKFFENDTKVIPLSETKIYVFGDKGFFITPKTFSLKPESLFLNNFHHLFTRLE
jgi:hypothetical protein